MNSWINYHHLYYFKTIAEEESVSKAAQKLRLGQPTLSAQLKQFEENIGVQLFERQHKKLVLTEHGKLALDYAKNIFKLGAEMVEVLHDRPGPKRPSLTIGALDSVPKQVIVQMIKSAQKIQPCQVSLQEGRSEELLRELAAHKIDIVLIDFIPGTLNPRGLFHRSITKQTVSFYAPPKFKFLRKGFPKSIQKVPVILPTHDSRLRFDIEHWCNLKELVLDVISEGQDIAVKKLMAINDLGLLPAADYAVNRQVLSGELISIGKLEGVTQELVMVSAQRKIENHIAKELMKSFNI